MSIMSVNRQVYINPPESDADLTDDPSKNYGIMKTTGWQFCGVLSKLFQSDFGDEY